MEEHEKQARPKAKSSLNCMPRIGGAQVFEESSKQRLLARQNEFFDL